MRKQFYTDDFYKDEHGTIYTGEYVEHNGHIKDRRTLTKVENPCNEIQGEVVRCNYTQIFYPNSSLILCNNIPQVDEYLFDYVENGEFVTYYDAEGNECDEEDAVDQNDNEIFQWYLIDNSTAERLKRSTNELIFYSDKLDVYILGVTHYGTAWDYVGAEFVY
ncbi:hypothetical protein SDC9_52641 [bioreactor metagenome]|uniref:Uncharacterized protein n=1 Tax=bioreactor metagenome TaxID=1076179 RepID=A0A644WRH3_9ZZZZ